MTLELGVVLDRAVVAARDGDQARSGRGDMQGALGGPMAANERLGTMFVNMLPVEGTEPSDVSDAVVFLASDESRFITAHELAPDAGVTEM